MLRTDLGGARTPTSRASSTTPRRCRWPRWTWWRRGSGLAFRYALSTGIVFTEDAEVLPNVLGDGRVLVNSTTKIAARLTESLSLGVSFVVNHDSLPAPARCPTDTALTVGLELAL